MSWKLVPTGLVLSMAVLAGCSSTSQPSGDSAQSPAAIDSGHSRCDAAAAQFAVGKPASPALLEQARTKAGAQTARALGPNDMITLEYRSDRLNLNTDQAGSVNRVNCG
ncbi:I78 family peptidase inhibitor [Pseudomonas huanghezhanensis]|uniref:I78 family peptidase inhibitor n=1 Tax=Pseudomonas huanghezhanensis TaxID=3002903 RepID=UPI00228640BE|nr:I78 family peptidase inhibitor [Pseudomonas sp. BSw22131]